MQAKAKMVKPSFFPLFLGAAGNQKLSVLMLLFCAPHDVHVSEYHTPQTTTNQTINNNIVQVHNRQSKTEHHDYVDHEATDHERVQYHRHWRCRSRNYGDCSSRHRPPFHVDHRCRGDADALGGWRGLDVVGTPQNVLLD